MKDFKYVTHAPQKHRLIIYREGGKYKETIFNDVLKFTIDTESFKIRKNEHHHPSITFDSRNRKVYIEGRKIFKIPE